MNVIPLTTVSELEGYCNAQIEKGESISLAIEMEEFPGLEIITNPLENIQLKLEYYKKVYDDNLVNKFAQAVIKIVGYVE